MPDVQNTAQIIRSFLLEKLFDDASANELNDATPLVSSGILDSIFTLELVAFLETTFQIEYQPNEIDVDHFETISVIANSVLAKTAQ